MIHTLNSWAAFRLLLQAPGLTKELMVKVREPECSDLKQYEAFETG